MYGRSISGLQTQVAFACVRACVLALQRNSSLGGDLVSLFGVTEVLGAVNSHALVCLPPPPSSARLSMTRLFQASDILQSHFPSPCADFCNILSPALISLLLMLQNALSAFPRNSPPRPDLT